MVYIIAFISSVTAEVVGHYLCKWLDRYIDDDN